MIKLMHFGVPDTGPLRVRGLKLNGLTWESLFDDTDLIIPEGHQLIVEKTGHEITVYRD